MIVEYAWLKRFTSRQLLQYTFINKQRQFQQFQFLVTLSKPGHNLLTNNIK